eukprot:g47083.t1
MSSLWAEIWRSFALPCTGLDSHKHQILFTRKAQPARAIDSETFSKRMALGAVRSMSTRPASVNVQAVKPPLPRSESPATSSGSPSKTSLLFSGARVRKGLKTMGLVLEIGEAFTKAGFAGESRPRHVFRTDGFAPPGGQAVSPTEGVSPRSVAAWQAILAPWLQTLYFTQLCCNPPDRPIFIIENVFWPYAFKEALVRSLFQLEVPGILFLPAPTLPLYTTRQRDGLVVDVGMKETRVVAICSGFPVFSGMVVAPLGMATAQATLRQELLRTLGEAEMARMQPWLAQPAMLDSLVFRSALTSTLDQARALHKGAAGEQKGEPVRCVLGTDSHGTQMLVLDHSVRVAIGEALFGKNDEALSLSEIVLRCLAKCTPDVRAAVAQNVVLAGATCLLPGLSGRLLEELSVLCEMPEFACAAGLKDRLKLACPPFPKHLLAWLGGSIVSALPAERLPLYTAADLTAHQPVPDWTVLSRALASAEGRDVPTALYTTSLPQEFGAGVLSPAAGLKSPLSEVGQDFLTQAPPFKRQDSRPALEDDTEQQGRE